MLTEKLKKAGFNRTRTAYGTTWVRSEAEGFWHPIRDGKVNENESLREIASHQWLYYVGERIEDEATTMARLMKLHH